jgi:hypothetical protein
MKKSLEALDLENADPNLNDWNENHARIPIGLNDHDIEEDEDKDVSSDYEDKPCILISDSNQLTLDLGDGQDPAPFEDLALQCQLRLVHSIVCNIRNLFKVGISAVTYTKWLFNKQDLLCLSRKLRNTVDLIQKSDSNGQQGQETRILHFCCKETEQIILNYTEIVTSLGDESASSELCGSLKALYKDLRKAGKPEQHAMEWKARIFEIGVKNQALKPSSVIRMTIPDTFVRR